MAGRIRTIKPEWIEDEKMVLASPAARVLSVALILLADDHGRGVGLESLIVSRIFPGHSREGSKAFAELLAMGFFRQYNVRGQTYFEILNWARHQRVDKPGKPRVPPPSDCDGNFRESPANLPGILAPDHDHDHDHDHGKPASPVFDFEAVYQQYPNKQGKKPGLAKIKKLCTGPEDYSLLKSVVETMARAWAGHDLKYCPHWSTFVNQERWRDEAIPLPDGGKAKQPEIDWGEPTINGVPVGHD